MTWLLRKPPDKEVELGNVLIRIKTQSMYHKVRSMFLWSLTLGNTTTNATLPQELQKLKEGLHQATQFKALPTTTDKKVGSPRNIGSWASDAVPIVVDSATTRTITPRLEDLIDPQPFKTTLLGIGSGTITRRGMVQWKVKDDRGRRVTLEDRDAYYSPEAPYRLLCPHSWKKHMDNKRFARGETEGDQANVFLSDDNTGYLLTWD